MGLGNRPKLSNNMKIALHLRNPDHKEQTEKFPEHLSIFYDKVLFSTENWSSDRIYVGDEFCPSRLPLMKELKLFCQSAKEKDLNLTLLTPVLTDHGLDKFSPLFEYLHENHTEAEVVVNDLGVLLFLKKKYPRLRLGAGRLFNKGFKDPRLPDTKTPSKVSGLLNDSTFDHAEFQEMMTELSVARLERDLLPYGNIPDALSGFGTSVYFPFGYVTTGRVCWPASFKQGAKQKFMPAKKCSCPCNAMTLELRNDSFSFKIIQSGNTIFYLYPSSKLDSLIKKAEHENLRLVYQGFAI